MGFLDKVQQAAKQGQDKLDDLQAKKKADGLLRDLGAWHYAKLTERDGGRADAEIARLVAELGAHEAEHGPLGGSGAEEQQAPVVDPSSPPPAAPPPPSMAPPGATPPPAPGAVPPPPPGAVPPPPPMAPPASPSAPPPPPGAGPSAPEV